MIFKYYFCRSKIVYLKGFYAGKWQKEPGGKFSRSGS